MKTKQTPGNNILTKFITIHSPCGASQQNYPTKNHQHNRSICFRTKTAITDIDKAAAFNKQFTNVIPYSTNKITWYMDHTIKTLPTTLVQLAITNNNSTGPDGINIRLLKHLGPLAIRYLTNNSTFSSTLTQYPIFGNVPQSSPF